MGASTQAFSVELERLQAVFGSNDTKLQGVVVGKYAKRISDYEQWFADGQPWLQEALNDIFAAQTRHAKNAEFYVWATEILCDYLGERLEDDDAVGDIGDLELATGLEKSGPPLPTPRHYDTPLIGFLTAQQVKHQYDRLKKDDLSHEYESLQEAREKVLSWLEQAAAKGQALVTISN